MSELTHQSVIHSLAMAGRVVRYHTWPVIHPQTVAEHSHRVAMIYLQLFGLPRAEVLEYILKHDLGELGAGDVPFYSKRRIPALKEAVNAAEAKGLEDLNISLPGLTTEEWHQFKISDLLEMYEFGQIEGNMGNRYGPIVSENILEALRGMMNETSIVWAFKKLWPEEVT